VWQYLVQHGYTQVDDLPACQPVLGVPVDRGLAGLLALSVLLIAVTVWLVR
jgi:hypothetical protein